jgi:hypothetical protein
LLITRQNINKDRPRQPGAPRVAKCPIQLEYELLSAEPFGIDTYAPRTPCGLCKLMWPTI